MKIAIISGHDSKLIEMAKITNYNKQQYCNRYGYDLFISNFDIIYPDIKVPHVEHSKFNAMLLTLEQNIHDWIVWIDTDALIMNHRITLEHFIDNQYDVIVGEDSNGLNSGIIFIKNCKRSIEFIKACMVYQPSAFDINNTPLWWYMSDQCSITRLSYMVNMHVVHHCLFNGYISRSIRRSDMRNKNLVNFDKNFQEKLYQQGDFIIHLAGIHNKLDIIKSLVNSIII